MKRLQKGLEKAPKRLQKGSKKGSKKAPKRLQKDSSIRYFHCSTSVTSDNNDNSARLDANIRMLCPPPGITNMSTSRYYQYVHLQVLPIRREPPEVTLLPMEHPSPRYPTPTEKTTTSPYYLITDYHLTILGRIFGRDDLRSSPMSGGRLPNNRD